LTQPGFAKERGYGPGINRAFKAIRRADIVLLVIDAVDGVTEQDQNVGRIVEEVELASS